MKVSRQDAKESNKTSVFWLYEFAHDLEKNAEHIDYLKEYLNKRKETKIFKTIDEKLADIRHRVGLDLAIKISNEVENLSQKNSAESEACECETVETSCSCPVKTASEHEKAPAHTESELATMKNILKYIEDMSKQEPYLDYIIVLNRCRSEDGLRFRELERKIDKDKLREYINSLFNKSGKSNSGYEEVGYAPSPTVSEFEADDRTAEYYNHAEPHH